ncbi:uncharacterized protein Hap1MRO34_017077 [Clarias gariepinus]
MKRQGTLCLKRETAALRGLPIFIREHTAEFFLKCLDTDPEGPVVRDVPVSILTVYENDDSTTSAVPPTSAIARNLLAVALPVLCWSRLLPDDWSYSQPRGRLKAFRPPCHRPCLCLLFILCLFLNVICVCLRS